jgi:hypothetical protein
VIHKGGFNEEKLLKGTPSFESFDNILFKKLEKEKKNKFNT